LIRDDAGNILENFLTNKSQLYLTSLRKIKHYGKFNFTKQSDICSVHVRAQIIPGHIFIYFFSYEHQ